ncbi:hypothetical protein LXL04_037341 [Taraxacum kok-saghyz]
MVAGGGGFKFKIICCLAISIGLRCYILYVTENIYRILTNVFGCVVTKTKGRTSGNTVATTPSQPRRSDRGGFSLTTYYDILHDCFSTCEHLTPSASVVLGVSVGLVAWPESSIRRGSTPAFISIMSCFPTFKTRVNKCYKLPAPIPPHPTCCPYPYVVEAFKHQSIKAAFKDDYEQDLFTA